MALHDVECCDTYQVHEELVKAVNEKMPEEDELYDLAELFKVFGDSTRIRILYVLYALADDHVRTIIRQGREHIEE